jgi:hypothetical protein
MDIKSRISSACYTPRHYQNRQISTIILLFVSIASLLYLFTPIRSFLLAYVPSKVLDSIPHHQFHISSPANSFCAVAVGRDGACCSLRLGAEPCLDECRKRFIDRETFFLTSEYETCEAGCLAAWKGACGQEKEDDQLKVRARLRRRRRNAG